MPEGRAARASQVVAPPPPQFPELACDYGVAVIRRDESIDAWVFLAAGSSLAIPWRGHSLLTIVGMLDAIERDYPTASEFESALGRLHARDLISVRGDRVRLRPSGRRLLRKTRGGRGFIPQWSRLEAAFETTPVAHVPTQTLLSAGAFDRALTEHLKRAGLA